MLDTVTGIELWLVLLLPSCPEKLYPQHFRVLFSRSAQVCNPLAETAFAVEIPDTVTGIELLVVLLLPS
jgi:hypothetical protein